MKFGIENLYDKLIFDRQNRKKIIKQEDSAFILAYFWYFSGVLHRMRLSDPTHSSQFMEWHNSGITTRKHAICATNVFKNCQKTK